MKTGLSSFRKGLSQCYALFCFSESGHYVWWLRSTWCWASRSTLGCLEEAAWSRAPYWAAELADRPTSLRHCSWSRQRAHFMVEPSHWPSGDRTAEGEWTWHEQCSEKPDSIHDPGVFRQKSRHSGKPIVLQQWQHSPRCNLLWRKIATMTEKWWLLK